ncbi:unnamed protein product [Arctia plantaginis]|uniref:Ionotropic receptor n=1 Tax=Arctia plantaginis TaxID=874455 RepID=A0A8S0Z8S5_ARCPL|nr:unnamed protein product [Arctia plantaginis]
MQNVVQAKDNTTIHFIKLLIVNEQKPTHLIYGGLCWRKNVINKLVKEMSQIGVRTSASFAPKPKYQDHQILYLTDVSCPASNKVLSYASSNELFQFTYRWLILTYTKEQSQLPQLQNSPVLADSDLVVAERNGNQFQMVETAKIGFDMLNATARYIFSYRYGYKVNGNWSGMIADLKENKADIGRMMLFVLFTALMALYAAYSANIVVLLQAPSDSIRNLPQLAAAKITLAANDVDYNHFVFHQNNGTLGTSIRETVFPENGKPKLYNLAEGVERIRKGLFAFHSVAEPVYRQIEATFLESEKCDISIVDFLVTFDSFAPVRKGSPYLELIRVVNKQIRESGIQSAIRLRYLVTKPHCTTKMSSFSSVGLMDMGPILILMLYGVAVSVAIGIGEIIIYNLLTEKTQENFKEADKHHVLNKLVKEMSHIGVRTSASFAPKPKHQDHQILYLTDVSCPASSTVLSYASSKELFQFTYRWLILTSTKEQSQMSQLQNSPVLADSDLVVAERNGNQFQMIEMHRPGGNASMMISLRGYYNGSLVDVRPHRELFRRRRNLMGHTVTMSNIIQDSNTTREHLPEEDRLELQYDSMTKACWSAAKLGFDMLNATTRYIFSYRYGYKVNGKWSGMIADLKENKADIGTNCLIFRDRFDVVTYTDSVASMRMLFIFRQPPLAYVSNVFYLPFSTRVWVTIAVCTVISTITIFLATKWEHLITTKYTQQQLDGSIGDVLLLTMSALTQQGCYIEPTRAPGVYFDGRMMLFVLFTALMALYAAYSANIVVLLQAPSNSIRNLPQLAAAKITLAGNNVDYNHFVFHQNNDTLGISIRERVFPENGKPKLYNLAEGVERIRKGLFAFHSLAEPVYRQIEATFLESEKCDISVVDFLVTFEFFVPVRKGSPYLDLIRVVNKQIRESGIQSAIRLRYLVTKPRCTTKMSSFSSVGLMDMRPALILMLYGVAVSVAIGIGEIITYNLLNRHKKTSSKKQINTIRFK